MQKRDEYTKKIHRNFVSKPIGKRFDDLIFGIRALNMMHVKTACDEVMIIDVKEVEDWLVRIINCLMAIMDYYKIPKDRIFERAEFALDKEYSRSLCKKKSGRK